MMGETLKPAGRPLIDFSPERHHPGSASDCRRRILGAFSPEGKSERHGRARFSMARNDLALTLCRATGSAADPQPESLAQRLLTGDAQAAHQSRPGTRYGNEVGKWQEWHAPANRLMKEHQQASLSL